MGVNVDTSDLAHLAADQVSAGARIEPRAHDAVDDYVNGTERDAKLYAPVFTGELKARIRGRRVGLFGQVVSEAPYSEYVEDGTSDTAPQPFMTPAHDRNVHLVEFALGTAGESML